MKRNLFVYPQLCLPVFVFLLMEATFNFLLAIYFVIENPTRFYRPQHG